MLVILMDLITIVISSYFCLKTIKKIGYGTRYIMYYFFFIIMVVPLFLDYLIGKPVYESWLLGSKNYGFILSYDDGLTRVLYDLYLLIFQWFLLRFKVDVKKEAYIYENRQFSNIKITNKTKKVYVHILFMLALLPVLLTILLPISNSILFTWGWREQNLFGAATSKYYYSIEKLSYIGLISSLLLLMMRPKDFKGVLGAKKIVYFLFKPIFLLLAINNICIESKRSILIFCIAIILTFLLDVVPKKKIKYILILGSTAVIFIVALSVYVKITYRDYASGAFDALYTTLRIDYFRDDTTKMLIYSIFNHDKIKVLEYPLQSYIMQIGYIFPLDLLDIPRLGYNTFFTCSLVNVPVSAGLSYTTTSMFDEMIANFGLIGFITAPLFSIWLARIADKHTIVTKTFIVAAYVLLVMYSMNYIMWFLETVLLIVFCSKYRIKIK